MFFYARNLHKITDEQFLKLPISIVTYIDKLDPVEDSAALDKWVELVTKYVRNKEDLDEAARICCPGED